MGIVPDPFEEFRPYFDGVRAQKGFYDKLVESFGRSACEGMWLAFSPDHYAGLNADGGIGFTSPGWGSSMDVVNDLSEIGLPLRFIPGKALPPP